MKSKNVLIDLAFKRAISAKWHYDMATSDLYIAWLIEESCKSRNRSVIEISLALEDFNLLYNHDELNISASDLASGQVTCDQSIQTFLQSKYQRICSKYDLLFIENKLTKDSLVISMHSIDMCIFYRCQFLYLLNRDSYNKDRVCIGSSKVKDFYFDNDTLLCCAKDWLVDWQKAFDINISGHELIKYRHSIRQYIRMHPIYDLLCLENSDLVNI